MSDLQEKLESFGIPSKVTTLKRKNSIFTMENSPGRTKLYIKQPKNAEVSVKGNKSKKQAVLHFREDAQTLKENIVLISYDRDYLEQENRNNLEKDIEDNRTFIPDSFFRVLKIKKKAPDPQWRSYDMYDVTIEVSAPERNNYFLVGFDEKHTFICQLPHKAYSVGAAHAILRPENISDNAVRVGEWFFDPVDDKEAKKVLSLHDIRSYGAKYNGEWAYPTHDLKDLVDQPDMMEDSILSDNHTATHVYYLDNNVYVSGLIEDKQQRHEDVLLNGVHRVVKNRELITDSEKWD